MDLIAVEKDSIEGKLRRDEGVVQQLRSSLEQSAHNTENLVQILESVQGRLKRLETTIIPVYKQTLEQTRMQKNVESSMIALDRVIGYHYLCEQVESKITAGPSASDLEDYLHTLEKLRDARDYFTTYCSQSVELDDVSNLFESGCDILIKEFRIILQKNSHPVPDSILIDLATSEELTPPEHFSVRVLSQLQAITRYLVSKGLSTDFMTVYFQIRSENLLRSLASMKDSDRSNKLLNDRKDSLHNILDQLPHRKFSKRKVAVSATGPRGTIVHSLNEINDYVLPAKDEPLLGSTSLMMLASAFLRLIEGEYRLMRSIIPSEHQELILDKLVEKSLANFLTEYETVYSRAKNSLTSKKEFLVVIPLFRIIKHMNGLLPGYQNILEKSLAKSHTRIMSLTIRCGELSMRFLEEFIGEISSQPCKITAVPKDGTVHEMTSHTMSFMEQLLEHKTTAGPLWAAKDPSLARIQEPALLATKGMASCQHRVLSTLTMKLEGKATCYENMCLRNIFLLNNYHFIRKTLTRNPSMITLLEQEMADLEDKFNELIGKQRKGYTAYAFGKLATHIQDSVAIPDGIDKLNAPLKQSIKDRFKGFNNEIDEIVRVQRSFSIPDTHLRDSMRTENVNLVVPLYQEFYRAYSKAPFTKNPEKYLKYLPDDVEKMLMSLFDSTS